LCRKQPYHIHCNCQELRDLEAAWLHWISPQGSEQKKEEERKKEEDYKSEVSNFKKEKESHQQNQKSRLDRLKELEADEAWKQERLRCCPKCTRAVEKIDGCDGVTCGRNAHPEWQGTNQQDGCGHSFNFAAAPRYVASTAHFDPNMPAFDKQAPLTPEQQAVDHGEYMLCDMCHNRIFGLRFLCMHCPFFHVCSHCEDRLVNVAGVHNPTHVFKICNKAAAEPPQQ
jgi:hypothetical protein